MKPGVPWSVKGIEPDVREAAKVAARRSGMTLGEWLNSKILETADDIPTVRPDVAFARPRGAPSHTLERTASRLEDIAEQLARLSQRDTATAQQVSAPVIDNAALHQILGRVESNERQTVEAFTAVNDRLSIMGRQIAQAVKSRDGKAEESPGFVALEKAVRNIVEHMETTEKRSRDNFKSLQDRMASLSQKAAAAPVESVANHAPAFSQLEQRLADLAQRVERSESSTTRTALPELLKSELTDLANRIDTVRDTAEQLASRAQTQAVQSSQQELRAIEGRIVGLIKEAQVSLTGQTTSPAEMQRLRGEIERLNSRIDDASRAQASGGDVMALKAAVEQLSTRVAQGPDMRPLAEMDRRILDITKRLELSQAQARELPQVSELERRMAELDYKVSEAVASRDISQGHEIESRLGDIASRVQKTEQQLGSLETIERAVNQLFESIEQQRNWTQEVAEGAANRVAQQLAAQIPPPVSLADAPEILALQQGIMAVRAASEASEGRNQETLEAVHETLEHIVTKLAELESAAIGMRVSQASAPLDNMQPAFVEQAAPTAATQWPLQAQEDAPVHNPFEDQAANNPFEDQAVNNPFEAVATSEPQFDSVAAPAAPEVVHNPFEPASPLAQGIAPPDTPIVGDNGDDFIAAARRAAQASTQPKSVLTGLSPGAARASEQASKKILGMGLFKPRAKKAAAPKQDTLNGELKTPAGFKAPANNNDTRRRKYIVMGIFLLAAVSVFTFQVMGHAKKLKSPAQPVAIEQQLAPTAPAPEAIKPQPQAPKPAQIESMLLPEGADEVLTGSVDKTQDNLAAVVEGQPEGLAPEEAGSMQLREAAAMGNAEAQFVIATRYLNGSDGVPQDFAKSAYWYGKAAAAGNAPAQYRLGTLYERGKGVAKDLKAALGWYERSASLGNVKAMHNAAVLAASGSGADKPDYARAFKWFSLGAAHGLKDSQFNLAILLERGLGTKANPKEALFWYSVAAKQNDKDADKRAAALAPSLATADLGETEKRLKLWKPEVAPDAANTVAVSDPAWKAATPDAG